MILKKIILVEFILSLGEYIRLFIVDTDDTSSILGVLLFSNILCLYFSLASVEVCPFLSYLLKLRKNRSNRKKKISTDIESAKYMSIWEPEKCNEGIKDKLLAMNTETRSIEYDIIFCLYFSLLLCSFKVWKEIDIILRKENLVLIAWIFHFDTAIIAEEHLIWVIKIDSYK